MDSTALWYYEKKEPYWGGAFVGTSTMYRIRHVTSGFVLCQAAVRPLAAGALCSQSALLLSGWRVHCD